jgi:hypothetical protein
MRHRVTGRLGLHPLLQEADLREGQAEVPPIVNLTIFLSHRVPQDRLTPLEGTEEGVEEMEELPIPEEETEMAVVAHQDQEEEEEDGLRNEDPRDQEAPKEFRARPARQGIQVLPDLPEVTGAQRSTLIDLLHRTEQ